MPDNFWTSSAARDPKRAFRFTVFFTNIDGGIIWYAKSVTKPKISFGEAEHNFLNHKFYYPGRAEWDPVTLTLVDPVTPDAAGNLLSLIADTGYALPAGVASLVAGRGLSSPSKQSSVDALGEIVFNQIDQEGNPIETWTLNNPFIKSAKYGDLDYSNDELRTVELSVRYDWATCDNDETQFAPV